MRTNGLHLHIFIPTRKYYRVFIFWGDHRDTLREGRIPMEHSAVQMPTVSQLLRYSIQFASIFN